MGVLCLWGGSGTDVTTRLLVNDRLHGLLIWESSLLVDKKVLTVALLEFLPQKQHFSPLVYLPASVEVRFKPHF